MKIAVSQKGDCSTSTQSERISSAIPQADRSTDGENDLVARVVGLGVVAVHSRAVHLNLDAAVRNLADLGHYRIVPFSKKKAHPGNVADITSRQKRMRAAASSLNPHLMF